MRKTDGMWVYPPLAEAIVEVGLHEVDTYAACCQNTAAQYIETRPIMDLCLVVERRLWTWASTQWWEQE